MKFVAINEMIHWATIGMFFKAASWSIAFIIIAKGATKLFFWNELIANFYTLMFNIIGYRLAGLEGLGISFLTAYFVYFIQVYIVTKLKYSFSFDRVFYKIIGLQLFICLLCFRDHKISQISLDLYLRISIDYHICNIFFHRA